MASGNLELTIGHQRLYAFTECNGERVHDAIAAFAAEGAYAQHFDKIAAGLLMRIGDRLTHPDHRVLVDMNRNVISYCAHRSPPQDVQERLAQQGYRLRARNDHAFFTPTDTEMMEWIMKLSHNI